MARAIFPTADAYGFSQPQKALVGICSHHHPKVSTSGVRIVLLCTTICCVQHSAISGFGRDGPNFDQGGNDWQDNFSGRRGGDFGRGPPPREMGRGGGYGGDP